MYIDEKKQGEQNTVDKIGDVLLRAADYIEEHGWVQGVLKYGENVCALGAIYSVEGIDWSAGYATGRMLEASDRLRSYLGMTPHRWNDNPNRTKEQVIEALRKAAYHK